MKIAWVVLAALSTPVWAQEIKMPANLEKLAAKATETVDISLNGTMLKLAGRFHRAFLHNSRSRSSS